MAGVPLEEVFKISGVPAHTFVEPVEYDRLRVALRTAGRGVIVEGPSGIGKSTAVARALLALGIEEGAQQLTARDPNDVGMIELLPEIADFGVAVVDDFHVLDDGLRRSIADLLKRLADKETAKSKLVIIGINRAGDSLIEAAPDLANRIERVRFEVEPPDKVRSLVEAGEAAFNVDIDAKEQIVEGAQGSFYLAAWDLRDREPLRGRSSGRRTRRQTPGSELRRRACRYGRRPRHRRGVCLRPRAVRGAYR